MATSDLIINHVCPCHTCKHFNCVEGEGWEDICNGSYIVHCLDGKDRNVLLWRGCGDYQPDSVIKECGVKQ